MRRSICPAASLQGSGCPPSQPSAWQAGFRMILSWFDVRCFLINVLQCLRNVSLQLAVALPPAALPLSARPASDPPVRHWTKKTFTGPAAYQADY